MILNWCLAGIVLGISGRFREGGNVRRGFVGGGIFLRGRGVIFNGETSERKFLTSCVLLAQPGKLKLLKYVPLNMLIGAEL